MDSGSGVKRDIDEVTEEADEWIGPMPDEAVKTKKKKGKINIKRFLKWIRLPDVQTPVCKTTWFHLNIFYLCVEAFHSS